MRSSYRFVVRAYPPQYRRNHGHELVDTASQLAPDGWSLRQSVSLLVAGLRTRARFAVDGSDRRAWAGGISMALVLVFVVIAAPTTSYVLGADYFQGMTLRLWLITAANLIPLCVLAATTRWPAALTITVVVTLRLVSDLEHLGELSVGVNAGLSVLYAARYLALPAMAWWLALRTPGLRAASPVVVAVLFGLAVGLAYIADSLNQYLYIGLLIMLPVAGLALVAVDPRVIVTATVVWAWIAGWLVPGFVLVGLSEPGWEAAIGITIPTAVATVGVLASRYGLRRLNSSYAAI